MKRGFGRTDAGRCFDALEREGTKVRACLKDRAVELTARRDGREVGHAFLDTYQGALIVGEIEVEEGARRSKVGTRLYEAALVVGCRAGLPVTSDSLRSQYAEAFWQKQQAKGRATCTPGRGSFYDGPTGGKVRPGLPIPGEDGAGDPAWQCKRYEIKAPCAVPSLASAPRAKRHRRARRY